MFRHSSRNAESDVGLLRQKAPERVPRVMVGGFQGKLPSNVQHSRFELETSHSAAPRVGGFTKPHSPMSCRILEHHDLQTHANSQLAKHRDRSTTPGCGLTKVVRLPCVDGEVTTAMLAGESHAM